MHPYISFLDFRIPSYGLCLSIAVLLCGFLIIKKACALGIVFEDMIILAAVTVGAVILGGWLLYIIVTYSPQEIYNYIIKGDFSFIANGGLVFYGGLIGGIAGGLVCAKVLKIRIDSLEKSAIPYIPLGHAIGRIGCLLAGCCHGFVYDGALAVKSVFTGNTHFPTQALEAFFNLIIMAVLLLYSKKERAKYMILNYYLIMYSVMRFFGEFLRGDAIRGGILFFSTSQWISILIFTACMSFRIYSSLKKDKCLYLK